MVLLPPLPSAVSALRRAISGTIPAAATPRNINAISDEAMRMMGDTACVRRGASSKDDVLLKALRNLGYDAR